MLSLKDIGILPAKVKQFNKKGIYTAEDLLYFLPRKYYDFTHETGLRPETEISCITIRIKDVKASENKTPFIMLTGYETHTYKIVKVMWFRQNYMYPDLLRMVGYDAYVCGKAVYSEQYKSYTITAPIVFSTDIINAKKIIPVYSSIQGMSDDYIRKSIKTILLKHQELYPEELPEDLVESEKLMKYREAMMELHFPTNPTNLRMAQNRMLFNDLLYFAGKLEQQYRLTPRGNAHNIVTMKLFNDVKKNLPYELSEGQNAVISDILNDMKEGKNVRALLSSDVGSGKTTVALLLSCALAGKTNNHNGYQVAWLVPSKTLAMQHTEELRNYLEPLGYEVLYLHAQMKKKEREEALYKIKNGLVNFIVGTHSILNDEIEFNDLAFIVCDESHRFGVIARNKLSQKVSGKAHLLTMSGTPIPRTLALVVTKNGQKLYTMERPSGRLPIKTCISNSRKAIFNFIQKEVKEGHQIYVVCPMINKNDSEKMEGVISVEEVSEIYEKELSPLGITTATLTGKNKTTEVDEIIDKFKRNETNVLIATSVIEVGINIPNATMMIIENAERFGIASLHQLRGRVGRKANSQGYCVLRSENGDSERLNALVREQNGFKLSEIDLTLRKSGDLIGEMQSGENKYVELMLGNQKLFKHISENLIPTLLDDGSIDDFIEKKFTFENKDI